MLSKQGVEDEMEFSNTRSAEQVRTRSAVIGGVIIILAAVIKYFVPINDAGWSISQASQVCGSGLGVLAVAWSSDTASACRQVSMANNVLMILMIVGGLIIVYGLIQK